MSKVQTAAAENRLAGELSPYLLQHKGNPVDWYPWGEAAFAAAREDDKPILLSVGYAACHWCHVMAHESFEDSAIAARMNELFVNIKVDREERPDLDAIYQSALALLGQQGGWPLTMFLTPKGEPFWGGTYFPPEPRYGRPGLPQVLDSVAEVYAQDPKRVDSNVVALREALAKLSSNKSGPRLTLAEVEAAAERLVREIDPFDGGFGTAPKFPQSPALKLLWRAWKRSGKAPYEHAVLLTLTRICQGGIYDHLGGGFARYTVDRHWLVPHFEKMLYDNAQLLDLLTWAWQETGDPLFAERARETVAWLEREMLAEGGGFAASLDADSEGEEGRFYVWDEAEIDQALGAEAALFKQHYDVTAGGNFEGRNILNRLQKPERASPEVEAKLARARAVLLDRRAARIRPGWDDKVLADWNGLMIAALARAAPAFEAPEWLATAEHAFAFVVERMSGDESALLHAWRRGKARHRATLDDYAFMSDGALALYEATGRSDYLERAKDWIAYLDRQFWDQANGGYFFTDRAAEDLLLRSKTAFDSATPAGNGALVAVLARLHYLTGEAPYRERAEALLAAFSGDLERAVLPLATLLAGCELLDRALEIVILGRREDTATDALLTQVHARCLPNAVLTVASDTSKLPAGHPAKGRERKSGKATAYLCRAQSCSLPITAAEALGTALDG